MRIRETNVEVPSGQDCCHAWFFVPEQLDGPAACIVLGHGFGLTRRCGMREFALAFASSGYAVLLFDYRGFGDSGGTPRQVVSFRRQIEDWEAIVRFARAQPEV
ncbi:MAG: alpha/beta hydrolase, partial [Polyangiales bacterium]